MSFPALLLPPSHKAGYVDPTYSSVTLAEAWKIVA